MVLPELSRAVLLCNRMDGLCHRVHIAWKQAWYWYPSITGHIDTKLLPNLVNLKQKQHNNEHQYKKQATVTNDYMKTQENYVDAHLILFEPSETEHANLGSNMWPVPCGALRRTNWPRVMNYLPRLEHQITIKFYIPNFSSDPLRATLIELMRSAMSFNSTSL